eukprot:Lithocolla_globosa_v1_NODE_3949_length_1544_cov_175.104097.p2 type:complete len:178 gc:universal NODE_3949_length_1544_cov_175.104097:979-446(-)
MDVHCEMHKNTPQNKNVHDNNRNQKVGVENFEDHRSSHQPRYQPHGCAFLVRQKVAARDAPPLANHKQHSKEHSLVEEVEEELEKVKEERRGAVSGAGGPQQQLDGQHPQLGGRNGPDHSVQPNHNLAILEPVRQPAEAQQQPKRGKRHVHHGQVDGVFAQMLTARVHFNVGGLEMY